MIAKFNERQLKRIKLLQEIVGSIKTPYAVDSTRIIKEIRGNE